MRLLPMMGLLAACASDHQVTSMCAHERDGFDIEEASVLQDAQGYPEMHDAVILDFPESAELPADATWRVKRVEILPMIPASEFGGYDDGQKVTVEVFDADDPDGERYAVTQTFDKSDEALTWSDVGLVNPTEATELDQKSAWWGFDFTEEIPVTGLTGPEYLVGVVWDDSALPTMGYSNFNRGCGKNWTDYADGAGWVLNDGGKECSWPMLRVELEVIEERADCDENSVVIE